MMQKFAFILFALSAALLGLAAPVQDAAIMERETNAQRFARGMPPMAPVRRSETEKRDGPHPSKRPGDHYARTPSENVMVLTHPRSPAITTQGPLQ
ncbi:hypothetical protein BJV74DRAFT_885900 [Russula compacta]|nr:hypothetical protein BJV74DRAFT_885900 [Russula compacta]